MPAPETCVPALMLRDLGPEKFMLQVGMVGGPSQARKQFGGNMTSWTRCIRNAREQGAPDWREYPPTVSESGTYVPSSDTIADLPMPSMASERDLTAEFDAEVAKAESAKPKVAAADVKAVERSAKLVEDEPYSSSAKSKYNLPPTAFEEDVPRMFGGGVRGGAGQHPGEGGGDEDWFRYYLEATDVRETIHAVRLKCAPGKPYATLLPISDVHIGPVACAFREWTATMAWAAKHEGLYTFTLGDCLNNATLNSVEGMDLGAQVLDIMPSAAVMATALRPIADTGRLLVLSDGNHEARWVRQLGQNVSPTRFVAERLNVPYSPYSFPLVVQVGEQVYTLYIHHGTGSGQSYGHLWNTMQRFTENNRCDAAIAGHRHVRGTQERSVMRATLSEDGTWYWDPTGIQMIAIGCWLRYLPGSYARARNMPPAVLGTSLIRCYADRHLVQPLPFSIPRVGAAA